MEDLLRFIFGLFGNITAFALFLSPGITFYKVYMRGSTEEFSGIPYVVTIQNCLLFAWYGLPFITSHNILVTTINGSGAAIEFIYICMFLIFAPPKPRGNKRKLFVGSIAAAFSASVYAAPLSIMRLVVQTKSVEYMPFFLSFCGLLCSASWSVYGILGRDVFVTTPNCIGTLLGVAQLVLYFLYKDFTPAKCNKDTNKDTSNGHGVDVVMSLPSSKLELTLDKAKLSTKESSDGKREREVTLPQQIA